METRSSLVSQVKSLRDRDLVRTGQMVVTYRQCNIYLEMEVNWKIVWSTKAKSKYRKEKENAYSNYDYILGVWA